jgi:type VI secretion system secreted protein Hcp
MAMGLYLHMKSAPGDATEDKHKDGWIKCESFRFGSARQIYTPLGRAAFREGRTGRVGEIEVTKEMDSASAYLFKATCHGEGETVKLEVTRAGAGADKSEIVYLAYELSNTLVTGYSYDVSAAGITREVIRLNFTKLKMAYTPQDAKASAKGAIPVTFDMESGRGEG